MPSSMRPWNVGPPVAGPPAPDHERLRRRPVWGPSRPATPQVQLRLLFGGRARLVARIARQLGSLRSDDGPWGTARRRAHGTSVEMERPRAGVPIACVRISSALEQASPAEIPMATTSSRPIPRWTRALSAAAFVSFLTVAGCNSTNPAPSATGAAGGGGASGAPSGAGGAAGAPSGAGGAAGALATGGPVADAGTNGAPAGLQTNGSIMYVRNK
jgi:hypothetical protein